MREGKSKSIFYYIFKFAGDRKNKYIQTVLWALMGVIFSLLPYVIMGKMVRQLLEGERNFAIYLSLAGMMALCWVMRVAFHTVSTSLSHKLTFSLLGNIRGALCDKLARLPLGTVENLSSGSLKNMMVERVDSMETTLAHIIPEFSANLAAPLLMFIYIFTLDWRMALLSLATLPLGILCLMWMMKDYAPRFQHTQETTKFLNSTAVEYISGIEVIKAFGKAENSYQRFVDAAKNNAASFIDWMRSCIVPHALTMTVTPATLLVVLPVGAIFAMQGSLPLADFIIVIILACGLITSLLTVMSYGDDIGKATSIFGEIDDLLNLPELKRPGKSLYIPQDTDISLSNVHFAYDEREVLHGINLTIPAGKVTALVGPSGSGKSTIAKLIASLWDVQEGSITLGGVDIRDMCLEDYYSRVAYVSQDTFLFAQSVRENIRMGNLKASDEEVENIARLSGCYDFIMSLEKGFDTEVGSNGAHLSGGERQRISIARAMLKNAPVLILDEATAYTDPENEAVIQQAVAKLAAGKTLIVIAHRLSTIENSDQIVVIQDGQIAGLGKHAELLGTCPLYKSMWQAHIYAKDKENSEIVGRSAG